MSRDSLTLETTRLLLRPTHRHDFEEFAAFLADAEAMRYLGSPPQSRFVAWRTFLMVAGAWAVQGFALFSVIEKGSGRWVGRVGPWHPEGWPGTEIGWGIIRDRWQLGYATEAATAAIDWAFAELGWTEIVHIIDPANVASQGVARKLGSRNRGLGRLPPPLDSNPIQIWGQTREEWLARRRSEN